MSQKSLTQGPVMKTMLFFALPLVLGDLLQQCYNIADTLVVSRAIGPDALAAVGSAFTLMTFLTSILLGLCLGSGAVFSMRFGEQDYGGLRRAVLEGDVETGSVMSGQVAGMLHEIRPVAEIFRDLYESGIARAKATAAEWSD